MTRNYIDLANKYIDDVLTGKVLACNYVKLSCQRQKNDLKRKRWEYHFDEVRASRVCKFIELLTHVKGPLAGQNIKLEPWQIFILTTVFGWVDKQGFRRYQQVYIEVPRGNGKSALSSGVALYMLCADGEKGADVYSFATTRDQAAIVFNDAQAMARANSNLKAAFGLSVLAKSLVVLGTNSKFLAKSADASTLDGLNTHCGIIDELHAHKTREVYEVVQTSIGKRSQPLLWCITTAGFTLDGICMEVRRFVTKILKGDVKEESQFGIIYSLDDGDDWRSDDALIKANPNWGISVMPKAILANRTKALADPSAENGFKTKHLDLWCNADAAWMQMLKWRKCYRPDVEISEFLGAPCVYAIDLAAKTDITAVVRLFFRKEQDDKVHYYVFPEFWLPSETVQMSSNSQYKGWSKQELIHITDGPVNDLQAIQEYILDDTKQYDVKAIAFDPWQAYQLAQNLMDEGLPMVELKPTVLNFSEPMKELQALVYDKRLHTDGNPVLEWMVSNVVAHLDAKDNIYPRKEQPNNKIDGVVALIMAINRTIALNVDLELHVEDVGPLII